MLSGVCMGMLKDWAEGEHECLVCGKEFYPILGESSNFGEPLCSKKCKDEWVEVSEALADLRDAIERQEAITDK